MPFQYIHTSARRGLEPGKSGFCCIARDRDLPMDLGNELERLSRFEHFPGQSNPVIYRHLEIQTRSEQYHVLSRIQDAGTDYSKRNNHIAHHLVFANEETATLPDPATILLYWEGWKNSWHEPPRVLTERDQFQIQDLDTRSEPLAGEYANCAIEGTPIDQAFYIEERSERELVLHFRNELLGMPATDRWHVSFTNFILASDRPTELQWRGNWRDRPLPFDFDTIQEPDSSEETLHAPEQSTTSGESEESTPSRRLSAPTVEIPTELTKAHRRRPKLKWTSSRFSKALNIGLVILALLCLATFFFLIRGVNKPSENAGPPSFIPQTDSLNVTNDSASQETELPRTRWDTLARENQLLETLPESLAIATQLANEGDPEPLLVAQALDAFRKASATHGSSEATIVRLPPGIVQETGDQWTLHPLVAAELRDRGLTLIPRALFALAEGSSENLGYQPMLDLPQFHDMFVPSDAEISLKAIRRGLKDSLNKNGIERIAAAEEYLDIWRSLESDETLKSIQKLEAAFGTNALEGFLSTDDERLLATPNQTDMAGHLRALYERFILPRVPSFGSSPEFREALRKASEPQDTAIGLARSIHQVFATASPVTRNLEERLQRIHAQWTDTFIRNDLMEETIINFNLERLANSKRSLARLQFQFVPSTINDLERYRTILESLTMAEESLASIDSETEWGLLQAPESSSP